MLDNISKAIPAVSLAALALFSVFNVGYFWRVGIHFLGLIDLSNLVYTFGLALSFITILVFLGGLIVTRIRSVISLLLSGLVGATITFIGIFGWKSLGNELNVNAVILLGLIISTSGALGWILTQPNSVTRGSGSVVLSAVMILATAFQAGIFTSSLELINSRTYTISAARGVIAEARILRSSSSGFIVAVDRKVIFLPQSQIKEITANSDLPLDR